MNFKQFEAFYWLAKLGSYQEVAKQINITQSAVSIRIGSLESELGAQLIRRDVSRFELTEKGYEVAAFAGEFMRLHEHMRHSLMNEKSRPVVIGMIEPIMSSWGIAFIRAARAEYSDAPLNFRMAQNQDLSKSIEQGEIDLVFGSTTAGTAPTSWRVRYQLSWVAHASLPIPAGRPLTTPDLVKLPLILYRRTLSPKSPLEGILSDIRALEHQEITVLSLSAMCEMVRNGLGIAPVVLAPLARDLETGDLRKIETVDPLPTVDACCLFINPGRRNKNIQELYGLAGKIAREWCERHPDYACFIPE